MDYVPFNSPTLDWLDVTFSPDDNPADSLADFITAHHYVPCSTSTPTNMVYRHVDQSTLAIDDGALVVSTKYRAYRISASGSVLSTMRHHGTFQQFLTLLASCPYRVTRLDAALDRQVDAARVLAYLDAKYPREVCLSRQRPLRTNWLSSNRLDGRRSGTWYAGHRSRSRVTARVYDKSLEVFDRTGIPVSDNYTRYELTFREGIANLNDAYDPSAIFWAHSEALLDAPPSVPLWTPSEVPAWVSERVEVLPYEALLRRVSSSSELELLASLADKVGSEGRNALMHLLAKRLGLDATGHHFDRKSAA